MDKAKKWQPIAVRPETHKRVSQSRLPGESFDTFINRILDVYINGKK